MHCNMLLSGNSSHSGSTNVHFALVTATKMVHVLVYTRRRSSIKIELARAHRGSNLWICYCFPSFHASLKRTSLVWHTNTNIEAVPLQLH